MNKLNIFAEIRKIDEDQRMVYGYASTDALDHQGERVAKEAIANALPDYMKFGNIREMHGNSAAGVTESATVDDKGLYIAAKIVDDNAWKKVKEKVYKGFSIGGKKLSKVKDTITKLNLTEISLVDRPANPEAVFDLYKADDIEKECEDNTEKVEKIAERKDVNPKEGTKKYGKVKFGDPKNKKYPIDTEEHIRAAWNYINKEKNSAKYDSSDLSAIKRRIVAAWKRVIDKNGPPSAAAKKFTQSDFQKGMYEVSQLACMLANLDALEDMVSMENQFEGDDSDIPKRLQDAVKILGDILRDMVDEEVDEMTNDKKIEQSEKPEMQKTSLTADDIQKAIMSATAPLLEKMEKVLSDNEQLSKRVKELESMPEPSKVILKAVDKSSDNTVKDDIKKLDDIKDPAEMIKKIHETGGTFYKF